MKFTDWFCLWKNCVPIVCKQIHGRDCIKTLENVNHSVSDTSLLELVKYPLSRSWLSRSRHNPTKKFDLKKNQINKKSSYIIKIYQFHTEKLVLLCIIIFIIIKILLSGNISTKLTFRSKKQMIHRISNSKYPATGPNRNFPCWKIGI